jgi:hypothetical protein
MQILFKGSLPSIINGTYNSSIQTVGRWHYMYFDDSFQSYNSSIQTSKKKAAAGEPSR